MKNIRSVSIILPLWLMSLEVATSQMQYYRKLDFSDRAKSVLNERLGKWDYLKSTVPEFDSTGRHIGWKYSDIITGDFNGDGQLDYAALIRTIDSLSLYRSFLVVLFQEHSTYTLEIVAGEGQTPDTVAQPSSQVLMLNPIGTQLYDFDSESTVQLPVDGIFLYVYEVAGDTYYYQNGEWLRFQSSD